MEVVACIPGVQEPPNNVNSWTESKDTELSAAIVSALFVGILMLDGHTFLGTTDDSSMREDAYLDEDPCLAVKKHKVAGG